MQDTVESSELVADVCVLLVYVMGCITHCKEKKKKRLLHVKVIRDKVWFNAAYLSLSRIKLFITESHPESAKKNVFL